MAQKTQKPSPKPPDDAIDRFCSHIISLSWLDALTTQGAHTGVMRYDYGLEAFAVSAFVVSVRDVWFLVTAGHVLHDLDKRLKDYGRQLVKSHLMDGLAPGPHFDPIPFMLGDTPQWYVVDNEGRDYALIPLRPLFVADLVAGGVQPLTADAWTDIPKAADAYFLIGFPKQAKTVTVTSQGDRGKVTVVIAPPPLQVQPVSNPPKALRCAIDRFYAKVPVIKGTVDGRQITLTDIDGMSGGPIFAMKRVEDGRWRYWVVAVQSSWERRSRVLAGCFIQPLISAIESCIDEHQHELGPFQQSPGEGPIQGQAGHDS